MKTFLSLVLIIAGLLSACSQPLEKDVSSANSDALAQSGSGAMSPARRKFLPKFPPNWKTLSNDQKIEWSLKASSEAKIKDGEYVLLPPLKELKESPKGTHFPVDMELTVDIQTEFRFFALHDNKSLTEVEAEADRRIQQYERYHNAGRYQQYVAGFAALRYIREVESGNESAREGLAKYSSILEELDAFDTYIRAKSLLLSQEETTLAKKSQTTLAVLKKRATESLEAIRATEQVALRSKEPKSAEMERAFNAPLKHRWEQTLKLVN